MFDPVEAVRSSCHDVSRLSKFVSIDDKCIVTYANELSVDERWHTLFRSDVVVVRKNNNHKNDHSTEHDETTNNNNNNNSNNNNTKHQTSFHDPETEWRNMGWTCQTLKDELTAYAILHLLNIGHGHKPMLRELNLGKYKSGEAGSAYVTMLQGVGRAILMMPAAPAAADEDDDVDFDADDASPMSAKRMSTWSSNDTAKYFLLPKSCPLERQVTSVLQETGSVLLEKGYDSMGDFITQIVSNQTSQCTVSNFVAAIVETIPAFCDRAVYTNGFMVHFYKKAFLLARDVSTRFGPRNQMYVLENVTSLTVMADNVLPAVLRAKGILHLTDEASATVASSSTSNTTTLPSGSSLEIELRATAVEACERIVHAVNQKSRSSRSITAAELDLWLWGVVGKEEGLRDVPRHYAPDTIYY